MSQNVGLFNRPTDDEWSGLEILALQATQAGGANQDLYGYARELGAVPAEHVRVISNSGVRTFACTASDNNTTLTAVFDYVSTVIYSPSNTSGSSVLVEFGAGDFPTIGGIRVLLPDGAKGLSIKGQKGSSRIVLTGTGDYSVTPGGSPWFALRIYNTSQDPSDESEFIEGVHITGLSVYDDAPWLKVSASEETHGLNIGYCKGASITHCAVDQVGDEGIEFDYCIGLLATNNHLLRCNAQERSGGAMISIKNGCRNFIVANNVVEDQVPALFAAGTYVENQRVLGSDGTVYGVTAASTTDDPVVDATDWEDISALNSGEGPKNYGIGVKVITAYDVTDGLITNNVINDALNVGIDIATPGADVHRVNVVNNVVNGADYGLQKSSTNAYDESIVAANIFKNIRKNGCDLAAGTANLVFKDNQYYGVADTYFRTDTVSDIRVTGDIVDNADRLINLSTATGITFDGVVLRNSGNTSDRVIQVTAEGQDVSFNNGVLEGIESPAIAVAKLDNFNGNYVRLDSPSLSSIINCTNVNGNDLNCAISRSVAGPLVACNNTIYGQFDLGSTARGLICLYVGGVSNKGSMICNNRIANADPTTNSRAIYIANQNSESGNVICTNNHCNYDGLGGAGSNNKLIRDDSTSSVVANNITA